METKGYRDLKVWQKSMELVEEVYRLTNELPEGERFGLAVQVQRAAVSVPSNIAEGRGRGSDKEFIRFINVALGSVAEVDTQLDLAVRLGYLTQQKAQNAQQKLVDIRKMLHALKNALNR